MRGETANFSTFSDQAFDEAAFEARLNEDRMSSLVCWYWILKLALPLRGLRDCHRGG
jgi:hypothetical protein